MKTQTTYQAKGKDLRTIRKLLNLSGKKDFVDKEPDLSLLKKGEVIKLAGYWDELMRQSQREFLGDTGAYDDQLAKDMARQIQQSYAASGTPFGLARQQAARDVANQMRGSYHYGPGAVASFARAGQAPLNVLESAIYPALPESMFSTTPRMLGTMGGMMAMTPLAYRGLGAVPGMGWSKGLHKFAPTRLMQTANLARKIQATGRTKGFLDAWRIANKAHDVTRAGQGVARAAQFASKYPRLARVPGLARGAGAVKGMGSAAGRIAASPLAVGLHALEHAIDPHAFGGLAWLGATGKTPKRYEQALDAAAARRVMAGEGKAGIGSALLGLGGTTLGAIPLLPGLVEAFAPEVAAAGWKNPRSDMQEWIGRGITNTGIFGDGIDASDRYTSMAREIGKDQADFQRDYQTQMLEDATRSHKLDMLGSDPEANQAYVNRRWLEEMRSDPYQHVGGTMPGIQSEMLTKDYRDDIGVDVEDPHTKSEWHNKLLGAYQESKRTGKPITEIMTAGPTMRKKHLVSEMVPEAVGAGLGMAADRAFDNPISLVRDLISGDVWDEAKHKAEGIAKTKKQVDNPYMSAGVRGLQEQLGQGKFNPYTSFDEMFGEIQDPEQQAAIRKQFVGEIAPQMAKSRRVQNWAEQAQKGILSGQQVASGLAGKSDAEIQQIFGSTKDQLQARYSANVGRGMDLRRMGQTRYTTPEAREGVKFKLDSKGREIPKPEVKAPPTAAPSQGTGTRNLTVAAPNSPFTKTSDYKSFADPVWMKWQQGRSQADKWVADTNKRRPYDPKVDGSQWSGLAKYRTGLGKGQYTPGTHWSYYRQPSSWHLWKNPFGAGSAIKGVSNWWNDTTQMQNIARQIRGSKQFDKARQMYIKGQMGRPQYEQLVGAGTGGAVTGSAFDDVRAEFARKRMALRKHQQDQAGSIAATANALKNVSEAPMPASFKFSADKSAAWDWVVNRGNKAFDQELEGALQSPTAAQPFFNKVRDSLEGKKPGFWQRINPLNWGQNAYLADPRAKQYMKQRMAQRLGSRDVAARLLPSQQGRWQSLSQMMGPMGWTGLGLGLTGLMTGNKMLAMLGLLGVGAQGIRQYTRAKDPSTWVSAFAKPRTQAEMAQRARSRQFLTGLTGMMHGKTGSVPHSGEREKVAYLGIWSNQQDAGPYDYEEPDPNPQAERLMRSHFPIRTGRKAILDSTNMSAGDKWMLLQSFDEATEPETTPSGGGTTTFGHVIPALAGAGLGYLGASLAAPVLGFDGKTKKRFGIGSAALGALLNSPAITRRF